MASALGLGKAPVTTQTSAPDPQAMATYQDILQRANALSQTPYQQYGGPGVAGLTPEQLAGVANINAYANAAQPYYQVAQMYSMAGANPVDAVSGDDISKYMNPYQQMVTDATMAQMQRQADIQQNSLKGNAAAAGAMGGSRQAVAQSTLAGENLRNMSMTAAQQYMNNYNQALAEANNQQQNEVANRARQAQAGYQFGSLGTGAQTAGLQGAGAQFGVGTADQRTQQAMLDYNRMLFQQEQAYKFNLENWYAGIAAPIAGSLGGTQTTTGQAPNPFMQLAGLGIAGIGAFTGARPTADGGRINGGGIFDTPGYIPQAPKLTANRMQFGAAPKPVDEMAPIMAGLRGLPRGSLSGMFNRGAGDPMSLAPPGVDYAPGQVGDISPPLENAGMVGNLKGIYADGGLVDAVHAIRRGLKGYAPGGWVDEDPSDVGYYIPTDGSLAGPARGSPAGLPVQAREAPNLMLTRERIQRELEDNPRLARMLDANTTAEAGTNPVARRGYMASLFDRAVQQGEPLRNLVNNPNYYPPQTTRSRTTSGIGPDESLWEGANPVNFATGNASYDPKTGRHVGFAGGPQTASIGGERYGIEGQEGLPYARAMGYTGPGRTAIGFGPGAPRGSDTTDLASMPLAATLTAGRLPPGEMPPSPDAMRGMPVQTGRPESTGLLGWLPSVTEEQRQGLMSLGLGMMASKSPNFLTGVGEGGQQALKTMAGYRTQAEAERHHKETAAMAGARLAKEVFQFDANQQLHRDQLEQTKRHNDILMNVPRKLGVDPDTGLDIIGIPDPANPGKFIKPPVDTSPSSAAPSAPAATTEPTSPVGVKVASMDPTAGLNPTRPSRGIDSPLDVEAPKVAPATPTAGLSPEALRAAAEYYNRTGKMPAVGGTRIQVGLFKNKIMNEAARMDAEAGVSGEKRGQLQQDYKSQQLALQRFMSGPQGNVVRGLNVAVDHAATLKELAAALKNGNIQLFNKIAQEWSKQTGNPAPTNFDTARAILGTEIIKALGVASAGTEKERSGMAENFSRASSPDQIIGTIDSVISPMLGGQMRGMRQQFTTSTGRAADEFNKLLFPATIKFLEPSGKSGSAGKKDPAARFDELIKSGVSESDAYKTLKREGY